MRENGTAGSQESGNGAKLERGWSGSINGMVGLRPALVGLGVSECSLNDTNKGLIRAC